MDDSYTITTILQSASHKRMHPQMLYSMYRNRHVKASHCSYNFVRQALLKCLSFNLEHAQNKTIDPQVLTDLASVLGCTEDYLRGKSDAHNTYANGMKTAIIKYAAHLNDLQREDPFLHIG